MGLRNPLCTLSKMMAVFFMAVLFLTGCSDKQDHVTPQQKGNQEIEYIFHGKAVSKLDLLKRGTDDLILVSEESQGGKMRFQVFDNDADFTAWASATKDGSRLIAGHKACREAAKMAKGKSEEQLRQEAMSVGSGARMANSAAVLYDGPFHSGAAISLSAPGSYYNLDWCYWFGNRTSSLKNNTPLWLGLFDYTGYWGMAIYIRPYESQPFLNDFNDRASSAKFF